MDNSVGSDVSLNDADSSNRSCSDSRSSDGKKERGESETPALLHELIIDDGFDDFGSPKKLNLNEEGEQWLRINYTPDPRIQEYIDKQIVANATITAPSQNSSRDEEKKEEQLASTWKSDTGKLKGTKTSFEPIMQTQEFSSSQKTLTQIQTQTQETGTQDSMSLMAYLNQPTQNDENEADTVTVGIGSSFEIVSGKDLSALYSESKPSAPSPNCLPNASAFLCFEEVSAPGAADTDLMTVKDMRLPNETLSSSNLCEEQIDLWRANRNQGEWKPLPRRKLTILCPGDQIRITTKPSKALKTAMSIDPDIGLERNTSIFLEYRRVKTSIKNKPKRSLATMTEKKTFDAKTVDETDIGIEMNIDSESQHADHRGILNDKVSDRGDKEDSNTFVRGTARGAGKESEHASDGVPQRKILFSQDSTVNSQQEFLRSSRMKLLNLAKNTDDEKAGVKIADEAKDSSPRNKNVVGDVKGRDENVQNDVKETGKYNGDGTDDNSSDATILDENYKALFGNDTKQPPKESVNLQNNLDEKREPVTNPNNSSDDHIGSEHSSDATVALSADSSDSDGSSHSSDSSEAIVPDTQEVDHTTAKENYGQTKKVSNRDSPSAVRMMVSDMVAEMGRESDHNSVLGTVITMRNTLDSSINCEDATRRVENRRITQEVVLSSNSLDKGNISQDVRNSVNHNDDVGEVQQKVGDKVEASGSTGDDTGLNKSSSIDNDDCNNKNASQARMKRRAPSTEDYQPEGAACRNQNEAKNVLSNKRRRTLESNKDTSSSIRAYVSAADELYKKRFSTAIERNVVNILVSGFEQIAHVSKLCKTRFLNVKKVKLYETVDENLTACILPTMSNDNEEASRRTLKAMQCALLGIPLVPLAWLEQCERDQKIAIPTTYIRTLPTKIGTISMSNRARYGVAKLAASRSREARNPCMIFQNTSVYLCGKFARDRKRDITNLLKEGNAKVVTTSRDAVAVLESFTESSGKVEERFVLLVGDRGAPIPQLLQNKIIPVLEESKSRSIFVVDSNWVSISIACASVLPPTNFKPKVGVDLWRLSEGLPA